MRIWDYRLLPYLSDLQFKGQLREITAIMRDWRDKSTTNHLLINRVMQYPKDHLTSYFLRYNEEYRKRYGKNIDRNIFPDWHNKEYLRVCLSNLYEKHHFGIGKSRINDEEWKRLCDGYKTITGEEYKI